MLEAKNLETARLKRAPVYGFHRVLIWKNDGIMILYMAYSRLLEYGPGTICAGFPSSPGLGIDSHILTFWLLYEAALRSRAGVSSNLTSLWFSRCDASGTTGVTGGLI